MGGQTSARNYGEVFPVPGPRYDLIEIYICAGQLGDSRQGFPSGSGIAPFLPIPSQPSGYALPLHIFLFCFRLPLLVTVCLSYFLFLQWLPIGSLGKKASLWCILGVPSLWWIDLQIDGVKRGFVMASRTNVRLRKADFFFFFFFFKVFGQTTESTPARRKIHHRVFPDVSHRCRLPRRDL